MKHPGRTTLTKDVLEHIANGVDTSRALISALAVAGVICDADIYARLSYLQKTGKIERQPDGVFAISCTDVLDKWELFERLVKTLPPFEAIHTTPDKEKWWALYHEFWAMVKAL